LMANSERAVQHAELPGSERTTRRSQTRLYTLGWGENADKVHFINNIRIPGTAIDFGAVEDSPDPGSSHPFSCRTRG
jgi:hypothetical protein